MVYENIEAVHTPADNQIIWRYRPLEPKNRLNSILGGSLYCSRLDQLQDQYEGRYPKANHDAARIEKEAERARREQEEKLRNIDLSQESPHADRLEDLRERVEAKGAEISDLQLSELYIQRQGEQMAQVIRDSAKTSEEVTRTTMFVNCWQLNKHESDVMWRAYNPKRTVAIRSTIGSLKRALKATDHTAYIGQVGYIDPERDRLREGNIFYLPTSKWVQYKHEEEARVILWKNPPTVPGGDDNDPRDWLWWEQPTGLSIDIDPSELINEVRVGPGASEWTFSEVSDICSQLGIDDVNRSVLTEYYS